jgi:urease accessory protein
MIMIMTTSMTKIAAMITAMTTIMAIHMIMIMRTAMRTRTNMTETAGLPLLVWLSPSFPVGAFAYSHGLEWAVEAGDINNAATCQSWISDLLVHGSGYNDAIIVAATHRAVTIRDRAALGEVAELAVAMQPSAERHLEATAQGNAFLIAARAAWEVPSLALLKSAWDGDVAYPVAVGVLSAGHGITLPTTLDAFLLAFSANLVSAAVRLGPIGQTDGQRILAALMPTIRETAKRASDSTLDDLGSAAFRSDLASLRHETQYTRLFRS